MAPVGKMAWYGWQPGYVGHAWLMGEIDSAQLDEHLTDPEALRALRDSYVETLLERYTHKEHQHAQVL